MDAERPVVLPTELMLGEPPLSEEDITGEEPLDAVDLDGFDQVEWTLRRLARARANLDQLADRYAEMIGPIDAWYEREAAPEKHAIARLTGLIQRYAVARRTREPEGPATFNFPSGGVATRRKKEPTIDIDNERVVANWLVLNAPKLAQQVCRFDVHPRIADIREHAEVNDKGEVMLPNKDGEKVPVPGLVVSPPTITAGDIKLATTQEDGL